MRFATRIQQGEGPYGALQDSIIGGLVAAVAVRVGIGEANETVERAMRALSDEEVVDDLNARIKKAEDKRAKERGKGNAGSRRSR